MTIREATERWLDSDFNFIPNKMVELFSDECEFDPELSEGGDWPTWDTWFNPKDKWTEEWCSSDKGKQAILDVGLNWIEHPEFGMFISTDGGGFDFFEAFWVPLYKKTGLHWHNQE